MNNYHFVLRRRYKAILRDGSEVLLNLHPEEKWYFNEQETKYLIYALRESGLDIGNVTEIRTFFIPEETEEEVTVIIGL